MKRENKNSQEGLEEKRQKKRRGPCRKEKAKEAERKIVAAERERQHVLEVKRLELDAARIVDTSVRVDHTSAASYLRSHLFKTARTNLIAIF